MLKISWMWNATSKQVPTVDVININWQIKNMFFTSVVPTYTENNLVKKA